MPGNRRGNHGGASSVEGSVVTLKRRLIYDNGLVGVAADKRQTLLRVCKWQTAARIIRHFHYSKKVAAAASKWNFVVLYKGRVNGALMLGCGQRPANNGSSAGHTIMFDRMWLSDTMPKYSETCVIGLLHTWLRKAQPQIKTIKSWSDTSEGNFGTIYKAANYKYVRSSRNGFYLLPDGDKIHRVSLYHRHGKIGLKEDFLAKEYPGIRKVEGDQLLFEYYL